MINLLKTAFLDALENTGNNPIYNTIRAIQSTLNVKMCTLWSINHNSTNSNESSFNSASLLVRIMAPGLKFPYLKNDEEYVHVLDNCFIEQIIKDVEKRGKTAYWEGTINNCSIHSSYEVLKKMGFSYFICIPIFQDNVAIAFLELAYFEKPFLENKSKIINLIRKAIGIAIRRNINNQKQSLINDLIDHNRYNGVQDIKEYIETFVSTILKKYIDYEGASIFLWDSYSYRYELFATTGISDISDDDEVFYSVGEGLIGLTASEKRVIIYDDLKEMETINSEYHHKFREITENTGSTLLCSPLFHPLDSNKVVGIIRITNKINKQSLLDNRHVIDYFNEQDIELITEASCCLALIIESYLEKNESINFCSRVSHNLRTPINAIKISADRIQKKINDEDFVQCHLKNHIQSIINYAGMAIMDLETNLSASHISQYHKVESSNSQSNSINNIIADSINLLRPYLREHNVSLDNIVFHELSPDRLLMVEKDSFLIIFYNLLINAVKYAKPNSEMRVEISAEESYGNLFVRVQDYGIGIKLEDLNNVFLYGYRSPFANKICAEGNGFGLYVAKEILQTYDCKISITNNNNPTTFEIEIPNSLFATVIDNNVSDKPKTILWIDDNIETSLLRPYLDEFYENGFMIKKIKNPDDLNHIIDSDWFSLSAIILDVIMPTGDIIRFDQAKGGLKTGLIVLKNLLNDKRIKNVPKIVFSVVNDKEINEFCKNNGIPVLNKSDYVVDTFFKKVIDIISNYSR